MFSKFKDIGICDIVLMVHELHKRGYQQLRLLSGFSPNGCAVRWNIYPKSSVKGTAMFERMPYGEAPQGAYHGSAGAPTYHLNPQELADHFLMVAPALCAEAKLPDEAYSTWFAQLAEYANNSEYPIAFGEYLNLKDGWRIDPSGETIPFPPFVHSEHVAMRDMQCKWSFNQKSWQYYLDKCIYFKGEVECPVEVLEQDKEQLWRMELEWTLRHFGYSNHVLEMNKKFFKQIIQEYKDAGLSHYRQNDDVCISMKAFLFQQVSTKGNKSIEEFKLWYEQYYYLPNAITKITKEHLFFMTLAYKGEEECPDFGGDVMMANVWFSEYIVSYNFLHPQKAESKAWAHEYYKWVARHMCKCEEPYDCTPLLDFYFQDFVDFKKEVFKEAFGIIM